MHPRVSIEYDHASGEGPGGRYGRFDTLFGMRRADLGPAGLYNAFGRTNFISPGIRVEAVPDGRTDLMATLRPIWLAAREDRFRPRACGTLPGARARSPALSSDGLVRHQLSNALCLDLDAVLLAKVRFLRRA